METEQEMKIPEGVRCLEWQKLASKMDRYNAVIYSYKSFERNIRLQSHS